MNTFISYSRESQDAIETLAHDFKQLDREVWFDKNLTGGQSWWEEILKRIRKCDLFVYALSPRSLDSDACKSELSYAVSLGKTILPILIAKNIKINLLPADLSVINYVDYRTQDKTAALKLYKTLNTLPDPQELPKHLPEAPKAPLSYLVNLKEEIESPRRLSFEQQSALVLRLKEGLANSEEIQDVQELLQRLKKREDLLAKIAKEIDALLTWRTKFKQRLQGLKRFQRTEKRSFKSLIWKTE